MKYIMLTLIPLFAIFGTTYYVDKDGIHGTIGNDAYTGTSWDAPWATISKAAQTMVAGDSVIVASAIYRETVYPLNSGSDNNKIVYWSDENAVVAGSEEIDESLFSPVSGYPHVFQISFSQFEILGIVQLAGSDSIILRPYLDTTRSVASVAANPGSFWHDTTNNILYIHTADGQPPDSMLHDIEVIQRNYGFRFENLSNITVHGFTIRSQSALGAQSVGLGIYLNDCRQIEMIADTVIGAVIRGRSSNKLGIRDCSINRTWCLSTPFNYQMLPHGMAGISLTSCDTVFLKNIDIWWTTDAAALTGDCDSVVIEDARWWGCPNHGFKLEGDTATSRPDNIVFRRCEAGQQCQEAIKFWYCDNVLIENCDLTLLFHTYGEDPSYHSTNIEIKNTMFTHTYPPDHRNMNIWIGETFYVGEYEMDYNCVYNPEYPSRYIAVGPPTTTKMTLQEWQNYSGQDMHSMCTDPYVVSASPGPGHPQANFYLTDSSPCIDAGDPSYEVPPNGGDCIDIGAYEFQQVGVKTDESTSLYKITILPNPFQDGFSICFGNWLPDDAAELKIFDITGALIFCRTITEPVTHITFPDHLCSGIYFALLNKENKNITKKILYIKKSRRQ